MGKSFLNLSSDSKRLNKVIVGAGMLFTFVLGIKSYTDTQISDQYQLPRKEVGDGSYEQNLIAEIDGQEELFLEITVEEQKYTEEEAEEMLKKAETLLEPLIKGENESLMHVTNDLRFVDSVKGTPVEVLWTEKQLEYFYSNGKRRTETKLLEPVELKISAILSCQEYTREYEKCLVLYPLEVGVEHELLELVEAKSGETREHTVLELPKTFQGKEIRWKKPMDKTFLYIPLFVVGALFLLKLGKSRDEQLEKQKRIEALEKDYAQVVSKFTMLLSAGLSIRNSWVRIVKLYQRSPERKRLIYEEMNKALWEMEKGISEIEVYEKFGSRLEVVHYKKLMALFVSDKRRGSRNLLEAMNQEMLSAWEEQKRKTRQQGEKIGTKLLIPMMGMLAVVFVMILIPAFLSFQL